MIGAPGHGERRPQRRLEVAPIAIFMIMIIVMSGDMAGLAGSGCRSAMCARVTMVFVDGRQNRVVVR